MPLKAKEPLTKQEKEIMKLRELGYTYKRIGVKLDIGTTLAERYHKRALRKKRYQSKDDKN